MSFNTENFQDHMTDFIQVMPYIAQASAAVSAASPSMPPAERAVLVANLVVSIEPAFDGMQAALQALALHMMK